MFGVPGPVWSPLSQVPLELIREGATLIRGPDDLLQDLELAEVGLRDGTAAPDGVSEAARQAWDGLRAPTTPDGLAEAIRMPLGAALAALLELELRGLVRSVGRALRTPRRRRPWLTAPRVCYKSGRPRPPGGSPTVSASPDPTGAQPADERIIEAFLDHLRFERHLSPNTLDAYRGDLGGLARFQGRGGVDLLAITHAGLRRWLAQLATLGYARTTVGRKAAAARTFFAWALRRGLIEADPAALLAHPAGASRLPSVLKASRGRSARHRPPAADAVGLRDRAALELLYGSGHPRRRTVRAGPG